MNKKAITVKEIMELILAIAAIGLLVFLLYSLIAPKYDVNEETAKSYFKTLEAEIKKADGGVGEFAIWQPGDDTFIIYFGNYESYKSEKEVFVTKQKRDNKICVCYREGREGVCEYCKSLDFPMKYVAEIVTSYSANDKGQWGTCYGWKYEIKKQGDSYLFIEVGAPEGWEKE